MPSKKSANTDVTPDWRSDCPLNIALELVGDRWSLLILRDLFFKGYTSFREFLGSREQIATNILSDRLKKLSRKGILTSQRSAEDARVITYRPTRKGLDLIPAMVELMIWADRYATTSVPRDVMVRMREETDAFVSETRERFIELS